jgi:hypothetical protein
VSSFEIQVYKSGIWNVDSYFDDRDMALSEAERLNETGRHAGVRILQEDYDEKTNSSDCRVVFSKIQQAEQGRDKRVQTKRTPTPTTRNSAAPKDAKDTKDTKDTKGRPTRKRSSAKKSGIGLYKGLAIAFVLLLAGIAAMIGLQEIAKNL